MNDDDDYQLQSYQDDLTTDDNVSDPLMDEENDNPAEVFDIPRSEFKDELDKEEIDELDDDEYPDDIDIRDDEREYIEDLDEDSNERGY